MLGRERRRGRTSRAGLWGGVTLLRQHPVVGHPTQPWGWTEEAGMLPGGEDARASLTVWYGVREGRGVGRAQSLIPSQLLQPWPTALGDEEPLRPHGRPLGPGRPWVTYNPAWVRGGAAGPRFPWGCAGMQSLAGIQLQAQLASTSGSASSAPLPAASRPPAAWRLPAAERCLPRPPPSRGAAAEGDAGEPGGSTTGSCLFQGTPLTP